ncbi:MAG: hypothetical protein CME32_07095 [Gimesia sp.]|nr:hypothetical protein [Gimesia sp.]
MIGQYNQPPLWFSTETGVNSVFLQRKKPISRKLAFSSRRERSESINLAGDDSRCRSFSSGSTRKK